ncbi:DNA-damage-repair/toleration protein [Auxenochlorella protothecoides]|uniref:DNA-damage-repair/toleration protein n=1 Tax=Auxenochlorella protothecoides TaxID=3075 RepID=A0A087SGZ9_AUXPR|nr:DNA-damage-repair/toleration protein [Auxenochlorella protothecoides]KFM25003.1 DNA-damage-repair/toleration protein [Auxenochlorella protothecoides]
MQEQHADDVEVEDLGILPTYYEAAYKAGQAIDRASGKGLPDRAILCSSRGQVRRCLNLFRTQGVAIVANKFKRVYATMVRDVEDAVSARSADHSNVLCLGARVTTFEDAQEAVEAWLKTSPGENWAETLREQILGAPAAIQGLDFAPPLD